jgi:hypothetical protein
MQAYFFDIGANRGFFTAKIFNLWTPGHGINGKTLSTAIKADFDRKFTKNKDIVVGVCEDTFAFQPMVCVGRSSFGPMVNDCQFRRAIKVISFDGQVSHVHDQRNTIYKHFPYLHPNYNGPFSISVIDLNKCQFNLYTTYIIPILFFYQATKVSESQMKSSWEYVHAALTGPSLPPGVTHGIHNPLLFVSKYQF